MFEQLVIEVHPGKAAALECDQVEWARVVVLTDS